MEMIQANQMLTFPLWQLLAMLAALTLCALIRKSIGMIVVSFVFGVHWVFMQGAKSYTSEGQEYTLMAIFFGLALICVLSIVWHYYKSDHFD